MMARSDAVGAANGAGRPPTRTALTAPTTSRTLRRMPFGHPVGGRVPRAREPKPPTRASVDVALMMPDLPQTKAWRLFTPQGDVVCRTRSTPGTGTGTAPPADIWD